ncbi:MAG TPA: hypothetical protein VD970_06990 [Acetobacteraceae bacterium]|nr:hypothetical protein [Acetobacteraceae bacterium]
MRQVQLPALRGLMLPLATLPLIPATLVNLFSLQDRALLGCLIGLGLPWLAARILRRGRKGDSQKAAILMGGAAAAATALGAGAGPIAAVLLGAGAWGGARLLYDWLPEVEPPKPPPPPRAPMPEGVLAEARARLDRIEASAAARQDPAIAPVAERIGAVLDDLAERPDRLPQARRFLAVHLDGLDRISQRLDSGALPPPTLKPLLDDLATAAEELRTKLRDEETAALDIQVKVLSDRLRQEGYG